MIEGYLFSLAGGFGIGAISGFALKRIIKLVAIILGAFFLGLMYLSYKGWVHADWNTIQSQTYSGVYNASQQVSQYLQQATEKISTHPGILQSQGMTVAAGIGFIPGLLIGLRH